MKRKENFENKRRVPHQLRAEFPADGVLGNSVNTGGLLGYRSTLRQERVAYEPPEHPQQDPFAALKDGVREIAEGKGYDEQHATPPRDYPRAYDHRSQEYRAYEYRRRG